MISYDDLPEQLPGITPRNVLRLVPKHVPVREVSRPLDTPHIQGFLQKMQDKILEDPTRDFVAAAVVLRTRDNYTVTGWTTLGDAGGLLGGLDMVKYDLLKADDAR